MPPRTLASLAQSLSVATDVEGALMALAESLTELDRFAQAQSDTEAALDMQRAKRKLFQSFQSRSIG